MAGEVVLFRIIKARLSPHCHLTASSVDESPAGLSLKVSVCPAAAAAGLPGTTPTGTARLSPEDPRVLCARVPPGGGVCTPASRPPRALPLGASQMHATRTANPAWHCGRRAAPGDIHETRPGRRSWSGALKLAVAPSSPMEQIGGAGDPGFPLTTVPAYSRIASPMCTAALRVPRKVQPHKLGTKPH